MIREDRERREALIGRLRARVDAAEPELQGRVEEARERLQELTASEAEPDE